MTRTFVSRTKQTGSTDERSARPVYLDCNATAPLEPEVTVLLRAHFEHELGNAGSRTHEHGLRAKRIVEEARHHLARVVAAGPEEVIFTSGATEANNIAILGLADHARASGRTHIVTTAIEHKAVLEPIEFLQKSGFEVDLVSPGAKGFVTAAEIEAALRPDTGLVSVMHANNETGILQPVAAIAQLLQGHGAHFHVDAAQSFGKDLDPLRSKRIDLISVSSHKVYGPLGIGALIARRRDHKRPPLKPIIFGGGQERGLRPGTLPVPLIAGFGLAASIAVRDWEKRRAKCLEMRRIALEALSALPVHFHGDQATCLPHVLNFSVPGVDSEALMVALKDIVSVSNGSACTSHSYSPSHVLGAMDLSKAEIAGAVRLSWSHLTPEVPWAELAARIASLT
jgi:cysteine desulfurase